MRDFIKLILHLLVVYIFGYGLLLTWKSGGLKF